MRIFNISSSLTTNVVKHVQLQKMAGCETMTSYSSCGIPKYASRKCGNMFAAANLQTLTDFADFADVVIVHTSAGSAGLLDIDLGETPIIWACHDYVPIHGVPKNLVSVIVPSFGYKDKFLAGFPRPANVIHRKVASEDWPAWSDKRINCTAIPGIISADKEKPYRNYSDAVEMLNGRIVLMAASRPAEDATICPTMELAEPDTMMDNLAMFDTVWAGCGNNSITFDDIVNNKMHEGIAAGAVPILYRSREMSEYADQYQCGITWNGSYPTPDEVYRCRKCIMENKRLHCLEFELPILNAILSQI